jgi:hypothetical protein
VACGLSCDRCSVASPHPLKGETVAHHRAQKGQPTLTLHKIVCMATPGECITWPHHRDRHGYGRIHINGRSSPSMAHQVAWSLFNVLPWPPGKVGRHLCHNGHLGCVNPHHITPGTVAENEQDKWTGPNSDRGCNRGSLNPRAIVTEEIAREIKFSLNRGEPRRQIIARFGISRTIVNDIARGRSWKHVTLETA